MATIVTRSGKGSPLTHAEVDSNFTNLNTDKLELSGGTMTGNLSFGDNDKAIFGAGSDLQIYHDGSHSYISDQGEGRLRLAASDKIQFYTADLSAKYAEFTASGAAELRYANATKFATTSTGVDITGTLTSDGLTVDGIINLQGTGPSLYFMESDTTDVNTFIANGSGGFTTYTVNDAKSVFKTRINLDHSTGDISFYEDTGTTPKFFWDASAESLGIGGAEGQHLFGIHASGAASAILRDTSDASRGLRLSSGTAGNPALIDTNSASKLLAFGVNGSEAMRIDSSGNVGIGTSSVDRGKLHVNHYNSISAGVFNDAHLALTFNTAPSDNDGYAGITYATSDSDNYGWSVGARRTNSGVGDFVFTQHTNSATGAERMRIDSSGNVGIGTIPQSHYTGYTALDLGTSGSIWSNRTTADTNTIMMANNAYLNSGATSWLRIHADEATRYEQGGGLHRWAYAASGAAGTAISWSETMRIDSSGNLLVGTTDSTPYNNSAGSTADNGIALGATGIISSAKYNDATINLNRTGTDGDIAVFRKDGSTVGSIGVGGSSAQPIIGSGNTGSGGTAAGLRFDRANNAIEPWNVITNASADATVDFGYPTIRFKDLYLSGGVYLGGTGSANKLDDYEEGTWTPAFQNVTVSYTERYGKYTKIGDTVHLWGYMVVSSIDNSDTSYVNIGGMPFTSTGGFVNGSFYNGSGNASLFTTYTLGAAWTVVAQNYFYLGIPSSTNNLSYAQACNASGRIWFAMTYPTAS